MLRVARFRAWLIGLLLLLFTGCAYAQITAYFDTPSMARVWLFAIMGGLGLLVTFLFPVLRSRRATAIAIWLPAIILRLALLPTAPSDDVNRYLWEGRLVLEGISPYAQTVDAASLVEFRDAYWEGMNHKDKPTAYPPLAELSFAAIGAFAYHPLAYKIAFVGFDLLTLGGILVLLRQRGLALWYSGFYALNPLILISYAGEAHFDAMMVAALVWAVVAFEAGRTYLAVVLASVATGIKWVTLPLIPFFTGKRLWVGALWALLVWAIPAAYFRDSLVPLLRGLFEFGGTRSFNGPIYELLLFGLGLPRVFCSGLMGAFLMLVLIGRWIWRDRAPLDSHIRWFLGSLIVLSPTVHFWYLAWIIPFVCLRPSMLWLSFSVTGATYFFVWQNWAESDYWGLHLWQQVLFWLPFFGALAYELWSTRGQVLRCSPRVEDVNATSVAVVIPVLNAAEDLPRALASIKAQEVPADELIIVDGGSTDDTRNCAEASGLPFIWKTAAQGRGGQILAGIRAAQSTWVIVLHSDAELAKRSVACLLRAVKREPGVIGGAFGQRFYGQSRGLLPIEVLNDARALFTRTAFGDQVQFFHRQTALKKDLMPDQPLMEDVESSWRTREAGGFLYLGEPSLVSHRKWRADAWVQRFRLVLRLVSRYRWARLKGRCPAETLSRELYDEYYSRKP